MNPFRPLLLALIVAAPTLLFAQETPIAKSGNLSPGEFNTPIPAAFGAADAVVLTDISSVRIDIPNRQWIQTLSRLRRIKILTTKGLEAGTITIGFSEEDNGDKLKTLQAWCYNINNGVVERTPVDAKDIFYSSPKDGDQREAKFTCPNMKVGSVIEYSYTRKSGNMEELSYSFQGEYPRLWSEFTLVVPDALDYAFSVKGSAPFYSTSTDSVSKEIWVGFGDEQHLVYTKKWAMKNVPAIKKEPFVSSLDNYTAGIHFQLSAYPRGVGSAGLFRDWQGASNSLLQGYFGMVLEDNDRALNAFADSIRSRAASRIGRAKLLYAAIRDRASCTYDNWSSHSLPSQVLKSNRGNSAAINFLLVNVLRKLDIPADPVILSTRDNGLTNANYPIMENINYCVVRAQIDSQIVFLDASKKGLAFGRLPLFCYNGHARVISKNCSAVFFQADTLKESRYIMASVTNSDGGENVHVDYISGYYESQGLREQLTKKNQKAYFASLTSSFSQPVSLKSWDIDSTAEADQSLGLRYDLTIPARTDSLLYFDPMLDYAMKDNPLPADTRSYPLEFPSATSQVYTLNMAVPEGYKVEELPKPMRVNLPDNDGVFEYLIGEEPGQVQLRCKLQINKAIFDPEAYDDLRKFYELVIKKESEPIVFRKIKQH